MNIYNIISPQPKCSICNKLMEEWNPWADYHSHVKCETNRISDAVIEIIKKQFEDFNNQYKINDTRKQ